MSVQVDRYSIPHTQNGSRSRPERRESRKARVTSLTANHALEAQRERAKRYLSFAPATTSTSFLRSHYPRRR